MKLPYRVQRLDHKRVQEMFDLIEAYALDHEEFDTAFVDSLKTQYEERESLSERQLDALENIVQRFHLE